ncbi:hypothetical protein E8E11_000542 [Didymella keratinophila]|nr:hypothetical protein E8E11_000542 [Didymella keratinophila]
MATHTPTTNGEQSAEYKALWANKYRGATVEDLDPPPALSVSPTDPISWALMSGLERDYTHLTVVSKENRALLGYISIPRLQDLLKERKVGENDPVQAAMHKFQRRGRRYKVIDMETPLEELEEFFKGGVDGSGKQEFAIVTDASRKFVLGVATTDDLDKFLKTRA